MSGAPHQNRESFHFRNCSEIQVWQIQTANSRQEASKTMFACFYEGRQKEVTTKLFFRL